MSQSSIRLIKTPEVDRVVSFLRSKYTLLSEAEIIKLALSEKYQKEKEMSSEQEQKLRKEFYEAIEEGSKIGDKYLAEKGINRDKMSEQELYDAIFSSPKDNNENNH